MGVVGRLHTSRKAFAEASRGDIVTEFSLSRIFFHSEFEIFVSHVRTEFILSIGASKRFG